jgi:glycosyltransferase 2 family protein
MKRWQFWLGLAIGAGCIAYVVSTIKNPREFLHAFQTVRLIYLAPIIAAYLAIMVLRAVRWRYILNHCGHVGYGNTLAAIFVCYMGNNIFPLRAGELMRVFMLGRSEPSVSYSTTLATVVVERLFDFLTVLLSLAAVLMVIKFPAGGLPVTIGAQTYDLAAKIRGLGIGTLVMVLVLFGFLILLNARTAWVMGIAGRVLGYFLGAYERTGETGALKRLLKDRPRAGRDALMAALERFASGLPVMGRPRALLALLLMSIVIWCVNLVPVWVSGLAFAEIGSINLIGCGFLLVVGAAAASIPGPPGFFGVFHAFNQMGLIFVMNRLAGGHVSDEAALSFAIVVHGCYYFPAIIAGAAAAWIQGYSLAGLRQEAEQTGKTANEDVNCKEDVS